MKTFKITFMTQTGSIRYTIREFWNKAEARRATADMVIIGIYELNEVGAIIG